jgi:protein gp37
VALFFKQWGGWRWAREVNDAEFESGLTDEERAQFERGSVIGLTPDGQIVDAASPPPYPVGVEWMMRTTKHAAGRVLDGRTWDEYPT